MHSLTKSILSAIIFLTATLASGSVMALNKDTKQPSAGDPVQLIETDEIYTLNLVWEDPSSGLILVNLDSTFACFDFKSKMVLDGFLLKNVCPHFTKNVRTESYMDTESRSVKTKETIEFSWISSITQGGLFIAESKHEECGSVSFNSDLKSTMDGVEALSENGCRVFLNLKKGRP